MYLFFDTETTGLPPPCPAMVDQWPRLVELAWLLTDAHGAVLRQDSAIIRPEGYRIPQRVTNIHGISTQLAYENGSRLSLVLERFSEALRFSHMLIGHNIDYDYRVIRAEYFRKKISTLLDQYPRFCTMKSPKIIEFCKVMRGDNKPKWPGLAELYQYLFEERYHDPHNAYADAKACAECFFKLRTMGVI